MINLILALGDKVAEDFIIREAKNITIIGITNQLDGLINIIKSKKPDVLVIRDNLAEQEQFLSTLLKIKSESPNLRIIVIAAGRKAGDILLATLVKNRIYDILYGEEINIYQVIKLIKNPLSYEDVKNLLELVPDYQNLISLNNHRSQKVISCWGAFDNLGTSTTALNLAITYAKNGNKTILVELDGDKPSLNFLLGFGHINLGTDTAVKSKLALESAIIKPKELEFSSNPELQWVKPLLRKLPSKLDFLLYSEEYCFTKIKEIIDPNNIRDIITSIVFHHDYDIVIFDLPSNLKNDFTKIAFEMSNSILSLVIPDYAVLIHTRRILSQLEMDNPGIINRFHLVLNESLDEIDIQSIFNINEFFRLPFCINLRKGLTKDIYIPASLATDCDEYNHFLNTLINNITPNPRRDTLFDSNKKSSILNDFKRILFG